jgi:hypothetical protein
MPISDKAKKVNKTKKTTISNGIAAERKKETRN